jgi:hypothetical protein
MAGRPPPPHGEGGGAPQTAKHLASQWICPKSIWSSGRGNRHVACSAQPDSRTRTLHSSRVLSYRPGGGGPGGVAGGVTTGPRSTARGRVGLCLSRAATAAGGLEVFTIVREPMGRAGGAGAVVRRTGRSLGGVAGTLQNSDVDGSPRVSADDAWSGDGTSLMPPPHAAQTKATWMTQLRPTRRTVAGRPVAKVAGGAPIPKRSLAR